MLEREERQTVREVLLAAVKGREAVRLRHTQVRQSREHDNYGFACGCRAVRVDKWLFQFTFWVRASVSDSDIA